MNRITKALQSAAASLMLLLGAGNSLAQKVNSEVDIMYYFGCHDGDYATIDGGLINQGIRDGIASQNQNQWNGNFRIGYQRYITNHMGLGLGLQYSLIRLDSIATGPYVQKISGATDSDILLDSKEYEHRTYFHNFSEKVTVHALSVPAMIYYQTNISVSWKFYMAGGAMLTFYPKTGYSTSGQIETREYLGQYQLEVGNVAGHNHIYTDSLSHSGTYTFKPNLSAIGELGLLYAINPRLDAYVAAQGIYRLTPLPEKSSNLLYEPSPGGGYSQQSMVYNGILNSEVSPKIKNLALGLQLGVRYRLNSEAKLKFTEYKQKRRLRDVEQFGFERITRRNFNDIQELEQAKADSLEQARLKEQEAIRQQHIQDSLAAIATADTATITPAADSVSIELIRDTIGQAPKPVDDEISRLILEINQNYCNISMSNIANQQSLKRSISRLSELMAQYSYIRILIKGHTCNLGSLEVNKALGQKRAENLRSQLIENGAQPEQIRCESMWWKEPLLPNTSEPNRMKNRRVELIREN
ncbi:MAG: OmpA family protein [Bacteroidales bacterium]|nr:OmpA family protein [Bacteroidales bacterium]